MAELIAIGTRLVADGNRQERQAIPWQFGEPTPVAIPGEEGTLLAVVPLPGSGKALAIVGYAVPMATADDATMAATAGTDAATAQDVAAAASGGVASSAVAGASADAASAGGNIAALGRVTGERPGATGQGGLAGQGGIAGQDRSAGQGGVAAGDRPREDGLRFDYERRRVWVAGAEVGLTFQEFELLAFLIAHPARIFSRAELLEQVWQRDLGATSRTVDVHVSRLRHKLGAGFGRCLVTEYRVGYQFRPL